MGSPFFRWSSSCLHMLLFILAVFRWNSLLTCGFFPGNVSFGILSLLTLSFPLLMCDTCSVWASDAMVTVVLDCNKQSTNADGLETFKNYTEIFLSQFWRHDSCSILAVSNPYWKIFINPGISAYSTVNTLVHMFLTALWELINRVRNIKATPLTIHHLSI